MIQNTDFLKIKPWEIKTNLNNLPRVVGSYRSNYFMPITIGSICLQIFDLNVYTKENHYHKWTPRELEKLPKITELNSFYVHIFEYTDKIAQRLTKDDERFYGKILDHYSYNELIDLIKMCKFIQTAENFI